MKRALATGVLLLCAIGFAIAQCSQPAKRPAQRMDGMSLAEMFKAHFNAVTKDFNTSGQPPLEILKDFKDKGFKAIINLRLPGENQMGPEEEAAAKQLGFRYFNIPVVYRDPKFEQADEFLKLTDDPANRPALIHCAVNIRAGSFFMIRRILRDGWTYEEALKEAEKAVEIAPHYQKFVREYVAAHPKK